MWSLEYDRNKHVYETETDSQVQSTGLWLPRGVGAEEGWRNRLTGTEVMHALNFGILKLQAMT